MSIRRGFETNLYVYCKPSGQSTAGWYKICTVGDIGYTQEKTAIQVKNRASIKTRVLDGMENFNVTLNLMAGTDPEDSQLNGAGFDAYSVIEDAFHNSTPLFYNFGGTLSNGTLTGGETELLLCTNFTPADPIDDIATATATLGISAISASSDLTPSA
jgi:hypothetical protein